MGQGSVDSVAHPGWGGRIENRPFNHLPRKSGMNRKKAGERCSPAFRRSKLAVQLRKYINGTNASSPSQMCDGAGGRIRTDMGFRPTTCEVAAFTSFATPAPIRRRTLITRRQDA